MPRTAEKVDELAKEGEHMIDALEAVMDVAESKGTVTWGDVSDQISSGAWGRLIEKGLLVDVDGNGFVVDDPDGVTEALEDAEPTTESADVTFTVYDKLAIVALLGMFVGYAFSSARAAIGETINLFLGPLEAMMPFYLVILILAVLTGLFSSIMQDNLMNMDIMSGYKEKQKDLQDRRKEAKERDDDEALERIQEEQMAMMTENLDMFKAQFRPMIWIMVFTIPVFLWLYWIVRDLGVTVSDPVIVMPFAGELASWRTGIIGPIEVWLVWYFVCSLGFTQIMRKALNVQTSPTG